jgi:hypothetical protein
MEAIYLDFECLPKPSTPVLLGILKDLRGAQHFEQVIVDDTLRSATMSAAHVRHATIQETAEALITEADAHDCPLVGWSLFDRDVLLNCGLPEPVREAVRRRYVNALTTARPWKTKIYPEVKIGRADRLSPKNTLDKFAELVLYPHVAALREGEPVRWIRRVRAAVKRTGSYRKSKKASKREWHAVLDYNEHDCRAVRQIWLKASMDLEQWREYERTTYCFQPEGGSRLCFAIDSIDKKRDALLDRAGVSQWAFITAWNPAPHQLSAEENSDRQAELLAGLNAAGYRSLPGKGIGEDRAWPPEASLFVMGILKRDARRLGRQFGQLAIVVGHKGRPARLVRC